MSNYLLEMQKIWERWCPAHLGRGVADTFAAPLQALPLPPQLSDARHRLMTHLGGSDVNKTKFLRPRPKL